MSLNDYVMAFQHLRTDAGATKYPDSTLNCAPHKPILLLCILDLAEQGKPINQFSVAEQRLRGYVSKLLGLSHAT